MSDAFEYYLLPVCCFLYLAAGFLVHCCVTTTPSSSLSLCCLGCKMLDFFHTSYATVLFINFWRLAFSRDIRLLCHLHSRSLMLISSFYLSALELSDVVFCSIHHSIAFTVSGISLLLSSCETPMYSVLISRFIWCLSFPVDRVLFQQLRFGGYPSNCITLLCVRLLSVTFVLSAFAFPPYYCYLCLMI